MDLLQTSKSAESDTCQYYLHQLYHETLKQHGYQINNIAETSGEILYASVNKILTQTQLTENDIFVDFGSGLGKIVLQVFLNSSVKQAYGIEIVPELYQKALAAAQIAQQDLPHFFGDDRELTFVLGDFLNTSITHATVALVNPICFPPKLLQALGNIIDKSPSIHTLFSLRPLETLQRFKFKKAFRVECSWDSALCYMYLSKSVTTHPHLSTL